MAKPTRALSQSFVAPEPLEKRKNIVGGLLEHNPSRDSGYNARLDGDYRDGPTITDPQYGIKQTSPMRSGTRLYSWEAPKSDLVIDLPGFGHPKRPQAGMGWGLLSDIEKANAGLYTGYNNGNYFTDGMSIRNTASPDHWRYKWFKQQEDDNYAWRESEGDRIYDLWDRGEISDKERRKQRSDMLEKFRMNDRKWNHGMSEGYKVPAHIRALYAVGLLKGY